MRRPLGLARWFPLALIRVYQSVPKGPTPRCRFFPSCSEYTAQAIRLHGTARGLWLGARRLGRCQPWAAGGVDPVPPRRSRPREGVA